MVTSNDLDAVLLVLEVYEGENEYGEIFEEVEEINFFDLFWEGPDKLRVDRFGPAELEPLYLRHSGILSQKDEAVLDEWMAILWEREGYLMRTYYLPDVLVDTLYFKRGK